MRLLTSEEYDIRYYDGKLTDHRHNAGYTSYEKYPVFTETADWMNNNDRMSGKKVLEIGCAKGFLMAELLDRGVDVYGVDFSQYAVDNAYHSVKERIVCADAIEYLKHIPENHFDFIIARHTLVCMNDTQISELISEMNRVGVQIIAEITLSGNGQFYNIKTKEEWLSFSWKKGAELKMGVELIEYGNN